MSSPRVYRRGRIHPLGRIGRGHTAFLFVFLKIPKVGKHKRAELPRYLRPCLQAALRPHKTHTRRTLDAHKTHTRNTTVTSKQGIWHNETPPSCKGQRRVKRDLLRQKRRTAYTPKDSGAREVIKDGFITLTRDLKSLCKLCQLPR